MDKPLRVIQVSKCPCGQRWILAKVEPGPPGAPPKQEQEFFESIEQATDAAERFLEPSGLILVPPPDVSGGGPKRVE